MFLPVEQAGEVTAQEGESDTVEDSQEENVEECLPGTTDEQFECTGVEEEGVERGQVSEGVEEEGTITGINPLPTPRAPRRNAPRNRRPPTKLSFESRVAESEDDRKDRKRSEVVAEGQSKKGSRRQVAGHNKCTYLNRRYTYTFSNHTLLDSTLHAIHSSHLNLFVFGLVFFFYIYISLAAEVFLFVFCFVDDWGAIN